MYVQTHDTARLLLVYSSTLSLPPSSSNLVRSYGDLESKGAKIVWGDFSEGVGKLIPEGESFDYVFDNYAKDVATCEDLVGCAKAWYVARCMGSAGRGVDYCVGEICSVPLFLIRIVSSSARRSTKFSHGCDTRTVQRTRQALGLKRSDIGIDVTSSRPSGCVTTNAAATECRWNDAMHDIGVVSLVLVDAPPRVNA